MRAHSSESVSPQYLPLCALIGGLMVATVGQAQNLIKDPSFENTKPRDRWGLVFSDWRGWIYAQPAEFRVGRIGRTGNTSCEIKGGRNCKIRLQSQPMELEPGRYRMRAYIRGLDIGPGKWRRPNGFLGGA